MRTKTPVTVTIDRELDQRLQALAERERLPFSQAVNAALQTWAALQDADAETFTDATGNRA